MPKTVLAFDLYGTLLDIQSVSKELKQLFAREDKGAAVAMTWRQRQLEYTWLCNSMNQYVPFSDIVRNTLLHAVAENGLEIANEDVERMMKAYDSLATFPDVGPALEKLASNQEVECVIFSNGTHNMVSNSVYKSQHLSPYSSRFKAIITVDDVKRYKPAPEVYEHLVERTGKAGEKSDIWLVSGNPFDVVGARASGLQAAWVDRAGNGWVNRQGGQPTVIMRTLDDLEKAIEAHHK